MLRQIDVPNAELIISQAMSTYTSKEAIEAKAIKDAQQFHTFHGAKYKLGESHSGKMQLMNNFGGGILRCRTCPAAERN